MTLDIQEVKGKPIAKRGSNPGQDRKFKIKKN